MSTWKKSLLLVLADQFAEMWFGTSLLPQDIFDSLASHVSASLALILFAVVMFRMYYYKSIECFVPPEWPLPWEQAAEAYCYMEGAYAVPRVNLNKTGPDAWEVKVPQTYYYWLPMILIVLTIILKMPDVLWSNYCQLSDMQPGQTLNAVNSLTGERSAKAAEQLSARLGQHLMRRQECGRASFRTARLFCAYMASKALRLLATLGSVVFLQRSFGLSNPLFGIAAWLRQSSSSSSSPDTVEAFPTLTFCDVALRQLGGWNTRTVQCVLPINLLLDKIAIFLWFWLVACGLLCVGSAVVWLVRVGSAARRRRFAKHLVKFIQRYEERQREPTRRRRKERATPALDDAPEREPQPRANPGRTAAGNDGKDAQLLLIGAISTVDRIFLLRLVQERLGMSAAYLAAEAMLAQYVPVQEESGAEST